MTAPSFPWCAGLFAAVFGFASLRSSAHACDDDVDTHWQPTRSWPAACEIDIPTDALIVLEGDSGASSYKTGDATAGEGTLAVKIERMVAGAAVETFDGKVRDVDARTAVFKSARMLSPRADYVVTAQRVSRDGVALGKPYTSAFTTGDATLPQLAFQATPTAALEAFDKELEDCEPAADACGEPRCMPTGETQPAQYVRVAVPEIDGGFAKVPYRVSANLTSGDEVLASADATSVEAGQRAYMLIEVPAIERETRGCVTITATDAAGHTVTSAPTCLALPTLETPSKSEPEHLEALRVSAPSLSETEVTDAESGAGCAIGRGTTDPSGLVGLGLLLSIMRLRARRRGAQPRC